MKAITIKQPWASLEVEGIKDIENRTWPTKFRGRVLIHAGLDNLLSKVKDGCIITFMSNAQIEEAAKTRERALSIFGSELPTGAIIGSVEIVDCVINHPSIWAEKTFNDNATESNPDCEDGIVIYNWVLANPIKFPEPIPAKGRLSFWDYPNILSEQEEEGGELFCHCQIPVKEENQVRSLGGGRFECRYCGGKFYK